MTNHIELTDEQIDRIADRVLEKLTDDLIPAFQRAVSVRYKLPASSPVSPVWRKTVENCDAIADAAPSEALVKLVNQTPPWESNDE